MASQPAVEGQKTLVDAEKCTDTQNLTLAQYTAARDCLIVSLTRSVAMHPGALETATIAQWKAARWGAKEQAKVILVTSHKREVDGPAPIPCDTVIAHHLEVLVTKLRPLVCGDSNDSGKLFLKSDGACYQKGTIGRRITAFALKPGVRADRPTSATDFRKWLVTVMQMKKRAGIPINKGLLRRFMCHSDDTAQTW